MEWIMLLIAGILEVTWAVFMKMSECFTRLIPSVITAIGYIASAVFLALALRKLPLGTAYAMWTGFGILGTTIIGALVFKETISLPQAGCILMIVVGIAGGSNRNIRVINGQYDPRGDFIEIAKAMKDAGIKIPIILDGGFTTPDIAEKAIADGVCDYIGLGRPTLADPEWPKKVKEGRPEDIVPGILSSSIKALLTT